MISSKVKELLKKRMRPNRHPHRFGPDEIAAMVERAAYGEDIDKIAADFECVPSTVYYHMRKAVR